MSASVSSRDTVSSLKNSESYSVHSIKRNLTGVKKRAAAVTDRCPLCALSIGLLHRRLHIRLAPFGHVDLNLGAHALAAARMEHHQLVLAGGNVLDFEGAVFLRHGEVRVRNREIIALHELVLIALQPEEAALLVLAEHHGLVELRVLLSERDIEDR